ncbi:hypothetical protein AB3Y40_02625 [Yoonia sp. R2331]|uniref:hypothetical protein n=1 Tax=Yoonia sp. R2331 TaxID=3237238 RepID=UPI0034E5A3EA
MTIFPEVTRRQMRIARVRCILLFLLFTFSLIYSVFVLIPTRTDLWIHGLAAFTFNSFVVCISIFTYQIETSVSRFKSERVRKLSPETMLPLLLFVPLFSVATSTLQQVARYESVPLMYASALANIPFMAFMIHGCWHGIRDPYMPAAFKIRLRNGAESQRS